MKILNIPPFQGAKLGIIAMLLLLVGIIFWAAFVEIKTASIVYGKLVYEGKDKSVQHLEGGRVKEIFAREGDEVEKGQVLLTLDTTQAEIEKKQLLDEQFLLRSIEGRLLSQLFPGEEREFAEGELSVEKLQIVHNQQKLLTDALALKKSNLQMVDDQIERQQVVILTAEMRVEKLNQQLLLLEKEEKELSRLVEKQLVSKPRLWGVQRSIEETKESIITQVGIIEETRQLILEGQSQKIRTESQFLKDDRTELSEMQGKLLEVQTKLDKLNYTLENSTIRAPITGTVMNLQIFTESGIIKAGETLLQIVPKADQLVIEAKLNPIDRENVQIGLAAYIHLLPFNESVVPRIEGTVIGVSPNIFVEETGASYYKVFIKFSTAQLGENAAQLYPGLPVEAMIVNRKGTFLQYLLSPIRSSFERAFTE